MQTTQLMLMWLIWRVQLDTFTSLRHSARHPPLAEPRHCGQTVFRICVLHRYPARNSTLASSTPIVAWQHAMTWTSYYIWAITSTKPRISRQQARHQGQILVAPSTRFTSARHLKITAAAMLSIAVTLTCNVCTQHYR